MISDATRVMIQISEMSDSKTSIHMRRLRSGRPREMDADDLALTARPARALRPQGPQRQRDLHTHQRTRLVYGVPAGEQQPPGQLDVLGGHARVVAPNGEHAVLPKQPEDARDDRRPVP